MKRLPSPKTLSRSVESQAKAEGLATRRVRRRIATIALIQIFNIARKNNTLPPFLVKGGRALEFRFGSLARSSRDVDIVIDATKDEILETVITVLRGEWSGFRFALASQPVERDRSFVFEVNADYNNADWARFEVEIVTGSVAQWDAVQVGGLEMLGLEATSPMPCMTIAEQIAQKLHGVSDPDEDRARDLYDLFILDAHCDINDGELLEICVAEFQRRNSHAWPPNIELREQWHATLTELLANDGLEVPVDDIVRAVQSLVLRLHGVNMAQNFQYLFVTLEALDHVPNMLEGAVADNERLNNFRRLTEREGWRLAHLLPYPQRDQTRAMLAVLEKPIETDE